MPNEEMRVDIYIEENSYVNIFVRLKYLILKNTTCDCIVRNSLNKTDS